jgi:hypothetical protein
MQFYWLAVAGLGVWRITHLLQAEDGPGDLVVLLRREAGSGFWGSLLDCFYCLSAWVAAPFALLVGQTWAERLLLWPALSAFAILLERVTTRETTAPSAHYIEDGGHDHALLRQPEATANPRSAGPSEE